MIIDYTLLSDDALQGLIEDFVTQEGTEYGEIEYSLAQKVQQVKQQLLAKEAVVIYDQEGERTCIVAVDNKIKA